MYWLQSVLDLWLVQLTSAFTYVGKHSMLQSGHLGENVDNITVQSFDARPMSSSKKFSIEKSK